jgi:hypothetical protein
MSTFVTHPAATSYRFGMVFFFVFLVGRTAGLYEAGRVLIYLNVSQMRHAILLIAILAIGTAVAQPTNPRGFDFSGSSINFQSSCNPVLQDSINRAVGLLHLFWFAL